MLSLSTEKQLGLWSRVGGDGIELGQRPLEVPLGRVDAAEPEANLLGQLRRWLLFEDLG